MQMLLCQLDQANTGPTAVLGPFSTHLPAACQALPCQRSPGTAGAMSHSRADKDGGLLAKGAAASMGMSINSRATGAQRRCVPPIPS
jgi:hypothetical protein